MSIEITTAMARMFGSGIDLLQQQLESRFRDRVRLEPITSAEALELDQVDATTMTDILTRHQDTAITSTPHRRRVITITCASVADLIDPQDLRRVMNNPQNSYVQSMAAASNRKHDDRVIAAFTATAVTGKGGTSTAAFNTTDYQIATGSVGMTADKMRGALRRLRAAENPKDGGLNRWYLVYSAKQQQDLLALTETTSSDFNTVKALVNGEINEFMGFEHVLSERLPLSSTTRSTYAWRKQSMALAMSENGRASVAIRHDKEDAIQVRYENDSGATRMDEKGVVEVLCTES